MLAMDLDSFAEYDQSGGYKSCDTASNLHIFDIVGVNLVARFVFSWYMLRFLYVHSCIGLIAVTPPQRNYF